MKGQHIAAVLAHPDTTEKVYNGIVDGLNELQTRDVSHRAQFMQAVIDGHNHQEQKRRCSMKKPTPKTLKTRIRGERPMPVYRRAVLAWVRVVRKDLEDGLRHLDDP